MVETISGFVSKVLFNRGDFYVLVMRVLDSDPPVAKRSESAKGSLFGLLQVKPGVAFQLTGEWVQDRKYGRQFSIQSWEPWAETPNDVRLFLHQCIDGFVEEDLAEAIAEEYGLEAFKHLSEHPRAVQDFLEGPRCKADPDDVQGAILGWERATAVRDISVILQTGGLGPSEVQAAITRFGTDAAKIIRANPYRLMEVRGFDYPKVDKLAKSLGVGAVDQRRVEGAILWAVHMAARQGHLFLARNQVMSHVVNLVDEHRLISVTRGADPKPVFLAALRKLIDRKALILDRDAGLYTAELYAYERVVAGILSKMLAPSDLRIDLKPFLDDYERSNKITLSEAQRKAVEKLTENRVLVLTGLPGTGKTTAVRVLVRAFEEANIQFALMAPTGIAAKRLSAVTGHSASTIHRALKFDGTSWGHHSENRLLHDAVIVDEVSMVDQELLYRLLTALREDTHVIFVGDDAQLPSVGPGNVLRELADCDVVPNVRLTHIFRQSVKGEIVHNAHKINRGEMLTFAEPKDQIEFKFVRLSDDEAIADLIVKMAAKLKSRNSNFQVLSPKYDGTVGVNNLNKRLRDRLNPEGPREWARNDRHFRLGDRLMVIKNDYARNVYNGDVGKLVRIHSKGLEVKIHGVGNGIDMVVDFGPITDRNGRSIPEANDKLRLAYAVTVHKSQGNEFDTIIMPIVASQGRMLQRNLLYTAVTRARQRVWLIGEEVAIQRAINNNRVIKRNTALSKAISDAVSDADAAGVVESNGGDHDERTTTRGADTPEAGPTGRPHSGAAGETQGSGD